MSYPLYHPDGPSDVPFTLSDEDFAPAFPDENGLVERKRGTSGIDEAVVAFSNADGGVILVGVEDDGTVVGRALTAGLEEDLHAAVLSVHNPGRYDMREVSVGTKPVTVLSIARRTQGFAQTANGRVLVRRGRRNEVPKGAALSSFIQARAFERFESIATAVPAVDADPALLATLREAFGWSDPFIGERLIERGLVTPDGRNLTVVGALVLTSRPAEHLGKAHIEILRFPHRSDEFDRRTVVDGPVQHQIAAATDLLAGDLGTDFVVVGSRRYELPRIPVVVLREAIANAVGHRQYEIDGVGTRVEVHPDRLVIRSPGSLPEPVTVANMRDAQSARNLDLMTILRRFSLAEDAGRGVRVMQDGMEEELLEPPRFADLGYAVEVTLPIGSATSPTERAWLRDMEARGRILPGDRTVILHAARGEVLTNSRVRDLLGVGRAEATETLQRLRSAGWITQRGRRGGASYIVAKGLGAPAAMRMADDELAHLVAAESRTGPVTNESVRRLTGVDRAHALRILEALVADGRLERRGERRGTHYVARFPQESLPIDSGSVS